MRNKLTHSFHFQQLSAIAALLLSVIDLTRPSRQSLPAHASVCCFQSHSLTPLFVWSTSTCVHCRTLIQPRPTAMSTAAPTASAGSDKPDRVSERSGSRDTDHAIRPSSSSRDKDTEKAIDRSRSSRDRDSHKRSRDRDGRRDSRDGKDGDSGDKDKERDRDRKRSRHSHSASRSRSHSRSPRRSHHRSSRPSSRSPSPPPAHSHHSSHSSGDAEYKEDKERIRAEHTVFVSAIHPKVKERELFDFFSTCGRVEDVRLIKDNKTKRSKGLAYIEFKSADAVNNALLRNGQPLAGYPVTIQPTQYPPTKPTATQPSADSMRLYIGSLQYAVTDADLRPIFAAIGPLDSIEVHKDSATGVSKGFGFVSYKYKADADLAMATLQGLNVAGRPVSSRITTEHQPTEHQLCGKTDVTCSTSLTSCVVLCVLCGFS